MNLEPDYVWPTIYTVYVWIQRIVDCHINIDKEWGSDQDERTWLLVTHVVRLLMIPFIPIAASFFTWMLA